MPIYILRRIWTGTSITTRSYPHCVVSVVSSIMSVFTVSALFGPSVCSRYFAFLFVFAAAVWCDLFPVSCALSYMVLISGVPWTSGVPWVHGVSSFQSVRIWLRCNRLVAYNIRVRVPFCVVWGHFGWASSSAIFSGSVNPGAFDEIHRACDDIPV